MLGRKNSREVRQIDLDVNRTYRDHIMFRERYNTKQRDLFHVLTAYSVYNTEVEYIEKYLKFQLTILFQKFLKLF